MSARINRQWSPQQRANYMKTIGNLKRAGKLKKSAWTAERSAKFSATRARQKAERLAMQAAEAEAAVPSMNGHGNGVDMDAGTPPADVGGTHIPLDLIPDHLPPMGVPAGQRRPRKAATNGTPDFPNNAEGARLAVAMELLRTVNALLRRDD